MKRNVLLLFAVMLLMPWTLKAEDATEFPTLSENGNDVWHAIYSHRAVAVMKDNGLDQLVTTAEYDKDDLTLQWKYESTGNMYNDTDTVTFKIIAKSGLELTYIGYVEEEGGGYVYDEDDGKYVKVPEGQPSTHKYVDKFHLKNAGEGNTFIFRNFKGNYDPFQLFCVEQESYVNKHNAGDSPGFCVYSYKDDTGNSLGAYISPEDLFKDAPKLSTETEDHWYYIKTLRQGRVFASKGVTQDDTDPTVVTPLEQQAMAVSSGTAMDNQLYKFVGDYKNFKVVSKTGGEFKYAAKPTDRIYLYAEGENFSFVKSVNTTYGEDRWELRHNPTGKGINETSQTACLFSIGDNGGILEFVEAGYNPYEQAPKLSTAAAPIWYTIQNCRSTKYFTFEDFDEIIRQAELIEGDATQIFRFEGSYDDGFKVINKEMLTELKYSASMTRIIASDNGDLFKFVEYSNPEYDFGENKWQLQYLDAEDNNTMINNHEGAGAELSLYRANDQGNALDFQLADGTSLPQTIITSNVSLSLSDKFLTVKADNMESVTIYNIAGSRVVSAKVSEIFEYQMPSTGYYVISVAFKNAKSENIKFIVK